MFSNYGTFWKKLFYQAGFFAVFYIILNRPFIESIFVGPAAAYLFAAFYKVSKPYTIVHKIIKYLRWIIVICGFASCIAAPQIRAAYAKHKPLINTTAPAENIAEIDTEQQEQQEQPQEITTTQSKEKVLGFFDEPRGRALLMAALNIVLLIIITPLFFIFVFAATKKAKLSWLNMYFTFILAAPTLEYLCSFLFGPSWLRWAAIFSITQIIFIGYWIFVFFRYRGL